MPTHANPRGAATTWVVWVNTWKNTCCGFLGIPVFALFFGSRRARTSGPILTIYTPYDVLPPKDVPFGGLVHTAPHFGGKIPKTPILGAWIGISSLTCKILKFAYYRNYCADYNQILHSHKDHQVLFVGGHNRRKTNQDGGRPPSWKIPNRPYLRNGSTDLREIWHDDASCVSELDRKLQFPIFKNF